MMVRVGYIPYLNMAPFHRGFGPDPLQIDDCRIEFPVCSPRMLGIEAEKGHIDAGAFSFVDACRLSTEFEPLGNYGIGIKQAAQSVLVFSKVPLAEFSGFCAVTDETATSIRLLEMLLRERYKAQAVSFGRIASSLMFDGDADALLLIGDEALRAKADGIPGFPVVTDLGQEWLDWQGTPFVFARWMVRKSIPEKVKLDLIGSIEKSLSSTPIEIDEYHGKYWSGFAYRLTPAHETSMKIFENWILSHAQ